MDNQSRRRTSLNSNFRLKHSGLTWLVQTPRLWGRLVEINQITKLLPTGRTQSAISVAASGRAMPSMQGGSVNINRRNRVSWFSLFPPPPLSLSLSLWGLETVVRMESDWSIWEVNTLFGFTLNVSLIVWRTGPGDLSSNPERSLSVNAFEKIHESTSSRSQQWVNRKTDRILKPSFSNESRRNTLDINQLRFA